MDDSGGGKEGGEEEESGGDGRRGAAMSCAFNAHLAQRCNKIDILIPLNLRMPVS